MVPPLPSPFGAGGREREHRQMEKVAYTMVQAGEVVGLPPATVRRAIQSSGRGHFPGFAQSGCRAADLPCTGQRHWGVHGRGRLIPGRSGTPLPRLHGVRPVTPKHGHSGVSGGSPSQI